MVDFYFFNEYCLVFSNLPFTFAVVLLITYQERLRVMAHRSLDNLLIA